MPAPENAVPVSSAAGVYRLTTESARAAIPSEYDFESAEGAIVVGEDGTVSGGFYYASTGPYAGSQARVVADLTIDPGAASPMLEPAESGFSFEATLLVWFSIEPVDDDPYTNPGTNMVVEGFVDPATGRLRLAPPEGTEGSILEFRR